MYKPLGNKLLVTAVKQDKEKTTASGIIMMTNSEPSPYYNVIDKGEDCSDRIPIGATIMLGRADFNGIKTIKDENNVMYLFVPEENISAIVEK